MLSIKILTCIGFAFGHYYAHASERKSLALDAENIVSFVFDNFKQHEQVADGVPTSYDWARRPRIGAGNTPNGFEAATGWGQVFYTKGIPIGIKSNLLIRNFQTLMCISGPNGMDWTLVQQGAIEGRQFRADFSGNISTSALIFRPAVNVTEVAFGQGEAFHFWPKTGRFDLASQNICGILVYLEARQSSGNTGSLLIGLGADYWTTKTAQWDNYKTNKDIAIGRLRVIDTEWRWFGMTTADGDALKQLKDQGYRDLLNTSR